MYSPEKIPFSFLKATLQKWLQILYMVPQAIQIALLERFLKQIVFTVWDSCIGQDKERTCKLLEIFLEN